MADMADQVIAWDHWDPSHSSSAFAEISAGRGRPQHLVFVCRVVKAAGQGPTWSNYDIQAFGVNHELLRYIRILILLTGPADSADLLEIGRV